MIIFIFLSLKNKRVIAKICSSLQVQLITELAFYWIITNHPATKPSRPITRARAKAKVPQCPSDSSSSLDSSDDELVVVIPKQLLQSTLNAEAPEFVPPPQVSEPCSIPENPSPSCEEVCDVEGDSYSEQHPSPCVEIPEDIEESPRIPIASPVPLNLSPPDIDVIEIPTADSPVISPALLTSPSSAHDKEPHPQDIIPDGVHPPSIENSPSGKSVTSPTSSPPIVTDTPTLESSSVRRSTRVSRPPLRMKFEVKGKPVFSRQVQTHRMFAELMTKVFGH